MKRTLLFLVVCFLRATTSYGDGSQLVVCTGNASTDTSNIAQALNQVCNGSPPATPGGEVILPPNTCLVNPTLSFSLCNNLTLRGVGPKSVLQVANGVGSYVAIFSATSALSNVVIKDFKVDQNPSGNPLGNVPPEHLHVVNILASSGGITGITISGMIFDPIDGVHAIHLESTGDLRATIVNNYFNFTKVTSSVYANAAVYLDGWQQVVTGNTFLASGSPNALSQGAGTAVETHGGRSTISNNTTNNYATAVNVMQPATAAPASNNVVAVANNSVNCSQIGISMAGLSGQTIRTVSIIGNTIYVCNSDRSSGGTNGTIFAGIRYNSTSSGDVDGVDISNNIISMQTQSIGYSSDAAAGSGGIQLYTASNLSNAAINGNIVTNSPASGIRVGSSSGMAQRVRVTENTVVDAGNDSALGNASPNRHAIGLFGIATDIDIMRNMIYDTSSTSTANGFYSLYLNPTLTSSVNIRTSQNTVRGASSSVPVLRVFEVPNAGIVDATNANDVQINPNFPAVPNPPTNLNVDFMSFTRYITTITGSSNSSQIVVNVLPPPADSSNPPSYLQWTVGQLVTFRFICGNSLAGGCLVTFDHRIDGSVSTYSTNGDLNITTQTGRAITFQVESFSTTAGTRRFFELYRSPDVGVPN